MDDFDWGGSDYSYNDDFDSGWDDVLGNDNTDYTVGGDLGWDSSDYGLGLGDTPAPDSDWNTQPGGTDWTSPNAGTGLGSSASGSNFPWTSALLNGGGAVLQGMGEMYKDKADWKAKTEFMKAQLAEQEKYYQLHGKQLSDALGGYAKYAGQNTSPTAGLLATSGGPSGYFH